MVTARRAALRSFERVNRELWLLLSLFVLVGVLNVAVAGHRVILSLFTLPTLFSAYVYGRRHATLTALASVLLVVLWMGTRPDALASALAERSVLAYSLDVVLWGCGLMVTGYLMGSLYERKEHGLRELRETYHGILLILRHLVAKDRYTEHHSYRVSIYATKLAAELGFDSERIEDVRAAALLHDIGKLGVSRTVLYKAARLTADEFTLVQRHVQYGADLLQPVGGTLRRVIPIVLAHHDKFDGTGYRETQGDEIPPEARVLMVADVYDALTSDRSYRKALPPFEARDVIVKGAGSEFDPEVVEAFVRLFRRGEMDIPPILETDIAAELRAM
jgi:putative nucleotidyltransferase with HDIG domain